MIKYLNNKLKFNYLRKIIPKYYYSNKNNLSFYKPNINLFKKYLTINNIETMILELMINKNIEYIDVSTILSSPDIESLENKEELRRKIVELNKFNTIFEELEVLNKQLESVNSLNPKDKDTEELISLELLGIEPQLTNLINRCKQYIVPEDEYSNLNSCILEISSGAGGQEAALFADELFEKYLSFLQSHGYNVSIIERSNDKIKGMKNGRAKIQGEGAFSFLKSEAGAHKVIRIPETESRGRLHSSVISVFVLPEVPFDYKLNEKDLKIEYMKAQGAGGQHVNTTDSACRITHIPSGTVINIQEERQQQRNKEIALKIIKQKVYELEYEKHLKNAKDFKKNLNIGSDRSDKIRTYNFQASRITDHRLNISITNWEAYESGEVFNEFITLYNQKIVDDYLIGLSNNSK